MKIVLNGTDSDVADRTDVQAVVASLGRGSAGIAVAVNGTVVPSSRWSATALHPGDRVEVLEAAQGG